MEKTRFAELLKALEDGDVNELQIFLIDSEGIDTQDEDGNTLLHHAVRLNSEGGVAMLINANPFIRNNEGKTPFNIAYENDNAYIAKMIDIVRDRWQEKHGKYEEEEEREVPFFLTDTKDSILKQFQEQNISDESLLDTESGNGQIVLHSVLDAWKFDFINEKMPPVVEILIDKAGDVEAVIEGFNSYMEQWENEIWDEPAVYAENENGEDDYRYETDPDEWIREIMPIEEWEELKEQMRAYAAKK